MENLAGKAARNQNITMNITQTNIDDLNAELTIVLEPADYQPGVDLALKNYRKQAQLPGFRPGHVPVGLIKQRFGKSFLAEEVNKKVQEAIDQHVRENQINVLGSPIPKADGEVKADWDNPSEFRFTYEMGLAPQLDIKLDKSESFTFLKVKIDDTLVNRQMKDMARRYGKLSEAEESSEDDMLIGNFEQIDAAGGVVEGGIKNRSTIYIETVASEELKKSMIGLKIGSSLDFDPNQLTKNHEELAQLLGITHHDVHHLEGNVRFTVEEIKRMTPHELNQELFDKLYGEGNVTSEAEMRVRVENEMSNMFSRDENYLFKRHFSREIVKRTNAGLPDEFLKRFIKMTNEKEVTEQQVDIEYPSYAQGLRWQLIENKIIRDNELRVSLDEAKDYAKGMLTRRFAEYGIPVEEEQLETYAERTLSNKEEARNIYDLLYENKVVELVKEKCAIVEKEVSYEDFIHEIQH